MSDASWYYAKPGPITPVALHGQNVAVWNGSSWACFKVLNFEGLSRSNALVFDSGAIGAIATDTPLQLLNLELTEDPPEMAQFRFFPLDDIQVRLTRGQSDVRSKTQNIVVQTDLFSLQDDPCGHLTEYVVLKGDEPYITCTNAQNVALAVARVAFKGFRFRLQDLGFTSPKMSDIEAKFPRITFVLAGGF
mgnify:CR=1 FL=1